jgi:hypothetical protein
VIICFLVFFVFLLIKLSPISPFQKSLFLSALPARRLFVFDETDGFAGYILVVVALFLLGFLLCALKIR